MTFVVGTWEPIDTAPKDGTPILATDPGHGNLGMVVWVSAEWVSIDHRMMGTDIGFYPTHWLKLPPLPASSPTSVPAHVSDPTSKAGEGA